MATDQSIEQGDTSLPIEETAQPQSATSWADMTAQDEDAEQMSISIVNEGIRTRGQEKAWSRVMDMTDVDLRRDTATVDRSGLNTYHFDPSLAKRHHLFYLHG